MSAEPRSYRVVRDPGGIRDHLADHHDHHDHQTTGKRVPADAGRRVTARNGLCPPGRRHLATA